MTDSLTPIPQPSEIAAFLIRNLSRVDDANSHALKKELQRLRAGKALSVESAMQLLDEYLPEFRRVNGNDELGNWDARPWLEACVSFCITLDCGALPAEAVRSVFDRVAVQIFNELFRVTLIGTGIAAEDIVGNPDHSNKLLWQSRLKDGNRAALARELEGISGLHRGGENWDVVLRRWLHGENETQLGTIFALMEHWDRKFGRALLLARIYRNYCKLRLVDHTQHTTAYGIRADQVQEEIIDLARSDFSSCSYLSPRIELAVNELTRLVHPLRAKAEGEAEAAEALFKRITDALDGQPRLAGFEFYRGLYHVQMGLCEAALSAFEAAANWFAFRSAVQMRACLHHLLNLAGMLGEQRSLKRWRTWCETLGMEIDIPDPALAVARDFPSPFPGAQPVPGRNPIEKHLIVLPDWEMREPDLRYPDRVVKGFGETPTPQILLFASLGQPEKLGALLDAGADPNVLDRNHGSALLCAMQARNDACVALLLPRTSVGVINTSTKGRKSPLFAAIAARRPDWVQALIARGVSVEMRGAQAQTALFEAVAHFASKRMFADGTDVSEILRRQASRMPAMMRPTGSPFVEDVETATRSNLLHPVKLAYFQAFTQGSIKGDGRETRRVVQLLLDAGANVNELVGPSQLTPFLYAAEIGNAWLLKTLIDHGADIRSRDGSGATAYARLNHFGHAHLSSEFLGWLDPQDRIWLREQGLSASNF